DRDKHPVLIPPAQTAPVETEAHEHEKLAGGERLHAPSPPWPLATPGLARESRSPTGAILRRLAKFRKILSPARCALAVVERPIAGRSRGRPNDSAPVMNNEEGNVMYASLLFTAAALAIAASAVPSTAQDKFGPWREPVNLGRMINSACANQTCESERPAISR